MTISAETLVNVSPDISSLPTIFHQINQAVEDPEITFSEIARIISGDPSLSGRLLRLANSSFYGFSSKIETISHAITIIGMGQLRDLVLATTVVRQFKNVPGSIIDMESFWKHSVACGLTARIIAVYKKEFNSERYYVLGMLHDLGRLLMLLNIPDVVKDSLDSCANDKKLLYKIEKETLDFDHAEVGGELLKKWNLPASLIEPVRYHHNPSVARQFQMETSIVHTADLIVHALELGNSGDSFVPPLDPKAWEKIQMPSSMISHIVDQVNVQFPDVVRTFSENS